MGNVNYGSQTLSFDFQQEAKSQTFNTLNLKLTPLGLYEGFNLVRISDSIVRVERDPATLKSICYISDSVANVGVRVELAANVDISVSSGNLQHYIVARMVWVNTDLNYMDVLAVEHQEPRNTLDPLKLFPDDLIIGKLVYDGSTLRSSFDLTRRDNFYLKTAQTLSTYLKVYPQPKNIDNTVYISSGQLRAPTGLLTINSSNKTITNLTSTSVGRNDIVWVDRNGLIQVTYGTETGGTPVTPPYGDKKVLAEIRRSPGSPVNKITGDQIVNVLTDYNIVPGTQDLLLATQTSFSGTETVDTAFQKIATGTFTFNGDKTFSGTSVFQKSVTITGSSALDILTLNAFGGSNLLKVDSAGKIISVPGKIDLQHATANIVNITNSASSLLFQFGGVNKLTLNNLYSHFYTTININAGNFLINSGLVNSSSRPTVSTGGTGSIIHAYSGSGFANDDGFLRLSAGGGSTAATKSFIDISGYSTVPDMDRNIVFGTMGVERARITGAGNVGIGAAPSSTELLYVAQSVTDGWSRFGVVPITIGQTGSNYPFVGYNVKPVSGAYYSVVGDWASWIRYTTGGFEFYSAANPGGANLPLTATKLLTIASDGNVGIGTTPFSRLTLPGFANGSTLSQISWDFAQGQSASRRWWVGSDTNVFGDFGIMTETVQGSSIWNTYRLYIGPEGNVGVGTTNPLVKLTSRSGINAPPATSGVSQPGAALRLEGGDNAVLDFGANSAQLWIQATDKTSLDQKYTLSLNPNGGNVGVGVINPNANLDVSSSGNTLFTTRSTSGAVGFIQAAENSDVRTGSSSNHPLLFMTNSIQRVVLDTSGNMGVATSTPLSKLHVNGNLTLGSNTSSAGVVGMVQLLSDQASLYSGKLVFGTDNTGWKFGISKNYSGTITDILTVADGGSTNNPLVGIGTVSPDSNLHIYQNAVSTDTVLKIDAGFAARNPRLTLTASGVNEMNLQFNRSNLSFQVTDGDLSPLLSLSNSTGNLSFTGNTLSFGPGAGGIVKAGNSTLTLTVPNTSSLSVPTTGTILTDSASSGVITGVKTFADAKLGLRGSNYSLGDYAYVTLRYTGEGDGYSANLEIPNLRSTSRYMTVSERPIYLNWNYDTVFPGGGAFTIGTTTNSPVVGSMAIERVVLGTGDTLRTPNTGGNYMGIVITPTNTSINVLAAANTNIYIATSGGTHVILWIRVS